MKKIRIALVVTVLLMSVIGAIYFRKSGLNSVTGKRQYISLPPEEEVRLSIEASPELSLKLGGLHESIALRDSVKNTGQRLISLSRYETHPYRFDFYLLAEPTKANAYLLPGGPIFITAGFLKKLKSREQLAAVIAHQIGHVLGRHTAEKIAVKHLLNGFYGASRIETGDAGISDYVRDVVNCEYNNGQELEADKLTIQLLSDAGYTTDGLPEVIGILRNSPGEFGKNHPVDAEIELKVRAAVEQYRKP